METIVLNCIQCEEDFEYSIYEQEKYIQKGFDPPLRCSQCRKNKDKKPDLSKKESSKTKKNTIGLNQKKFLINASESGDSYTAIGIIAFDQI